jgi:UMF1 family MFS transporter
MKFFCYLGSFCCVLLSFFDKNHLEISMLLFVMAGIGFWSSLVFYNAFLLEIAEKKDHDSLSARGFSMGYFGSVILLLFCLFLIFNSQESERAFYTRLCFTLTGLWWFCFSQITFKSLPRGEKIRIKDKSTYQKGILELNKVRLYIMKTKRLKRFIYSFFVYSMAVQTIMLVAVYFGTKEVNWGEGANAKMGLIIGVLLIQLIAIPGAILLSKISKFKGNLFALKLVVFIWILLCLSALLVYEPIHFYLISGFVGLVMGGIQSLSRSTFSKYIPPDTKDTTSFFSFYDISEKLGIVIGMFSYGFIEQITGSMRNSIVALVVFFVVGLLLLFQVPKEEISMEKYG